MAASMGFLVLDSRLRGNDSCGMAA
jgi:hypothetical protein